MFFNEIEFGRIWHRKVTLKTQNLQISILNFKSYVALTKNFQNIESAIYHSNKLRIDAEDAAKFLNGIIRINR